MQDYLKRYFKQEQITEDNILEVLCKSNLLKLSDDNYGFSYKYIFYFLIAQKISSEIEKYENLIYNLCEDIHSEISANILIFLTHHSKAQVLIDNIVFTSQLPFEKSKPLTLDKNDDFVKFISEFTKEIKDEILEEINPQEIVNKELKRKDEIEFKNRKNEDTEDDNVLPSELIEMNQAFRTVRIIGQIVKNQSGDFEKDKLLHLVEAAYSTIFRFLGYFSSMLENDKELIIETITSEIEEKANKRKRYEPIDSKKIERTVRKILQFLAWRVCVDSMTSLMFFVGTKGLDELFDTVNTKMDSTASKIVTFAIKTFNDKISVKELESLFEDVKDNYLAQCILREYIKRYLYTHNVSKPKRDKIIQISGFTIKQLVRKLKTE